MNGRSLLSPAVGLAARLSIVSQTQTFPPDDARAALRRLAAGDVRVREVV
jgi:hypothetical protein